MPSSPAVTLTATSVADPSRTAAATIQLTGTPTLAVSPGGATLPLEQSLQFSASLGGMPTTAVTWSVNGIAGGNTVVGTISNSASLNGLYLAPVNMPAARQVTIAATSAAAPVLSASVTLQLTSTIAVGVTPTASTRVPGARQTFTVAVTGTSNPNVEWTVNDVPGGNSTYGQVCLTGSNPCVAPPLSVPPGSVDYLAPAGLPAPAQVTVKAVSAADPAQAGAATVSIIPQITVNVSPGAFTIPPGQVRSISATVLGVADQNVTWDVDGSVNGSIAGGLICLPASNPCQAPDGPVAGPVEYRAPAAPPSPNTVTLRATSEQAPAAQGTAAIAISTAPFITGLLPASVFAGVANPFNLRVEGVQFAPTSAGGGTAVSINGSARATVCPSTTECDVTLVPADVASAGSVTISVQNPGPPAAAGNEVVLVVVAPQFSEDVINLDAGAPAATGKDIMVVEPAVAGSASPEAPALLEIGLVDTASGACNLGAGPVPLARPASGSRQFTLCVFGIGLDQAMQASFSQPPAPDLVVTSLSPAQGGLILEFTVSVPATSSPGMRTLFLDTDNQDRASLSGAVEVK
jgi:hypothetical protein